MLPAWRAISTLLVLGLLGGCALFRPPEPGIGKSLEWSDLTGWESDRHTEAWPALQHSCKARGRKPDWKAICSAAAELANPDDETARKFFENWFVPHRVHGANRQKKGLITGYYEPLLHGSYTRSERFRHPLFGRPESLLIIDLGDRFPTLKDQRVRGRLEGNRVIPYYTRAEIDGSESPLQGNEILWLDDPNELFFLHIQGSGRVQLDDGQVIGVGYADQNGHPYRAIGRDLVERGELALEEVTLFSIRRWLRDNPDEAEALLFENPSYVFFVLREAPEKGPVGSLNVPLTPIRSLAIDPKLVNLGVPIWLDTHYPGQEDRPLRRLVMAQDTGGAIKGNLRADLFWGHGEEAERQAGEMKSQGSLVVLLPRVISAQE